MRLLRLPLVHFVVIGAVWFALFHSAADYGAEGEAGRIVMSATEVDDLRQAWIDEHGATPSAVTLRRLLQDAIDEEVLFREAMVWQLDEQAPVVHDRLLSLADFVEESPGEDEGALVRAARRLGLQRQDVVIRRHLVQSMKLLLGRSRPADTVDPEQLADYYARHQREYVQEPQLRLTHVYVSRDRAGSELQAEAEQWLERLRGEGVTPAAAVGLGDRFYRGATIGPLPTASLQRVFGAEFAAAIASQPVAQWSGPIVSSYGLHLLWVHEHHAARVPLLDEVRGQVVHRYLAERRQHLLHARLDRLRARYTIQIQGQELPGRE